MHPDGRKRQLVFSDSLRMYTMYMLRMCLTWTFILKFSIVRFLVEEKISPVISLMLLMEGRTRGNPEMGRSKETSYH